MLREVLKGKNFQEWLQVWEEHFVDKKKRKHCVHVGIQEYFNIIEEMVGKEEKSTKKLF